METSRVFAPAYLLAAEYPAVGQIACLILARNEAGVIEAALESIRSAVPPGSPILVVADHCSDDTAARAARAGATVLLREEGPAAGKGAALAWFFRSHWELVRDCRAILVLDADSRLAASADAFLAAHPGTGAALQCRIAPVEHEASPLGRLIALSEIVEQSVHDRLRTWLGWPVRLRGTGMLLPPALLRDACAGLATEVEDAALTLLLAASGVKLGRLDEVVVYDPKPQASAAAARQRARWFRGQWEALWRYRSQVVRIACRGPSGWSLLAALFLKPRWLAAAAALALALACWPWPWAAAPFLAYLLFEAGALAAGLVLLGEERRPYMKALLHFPAFALMWLRGLGLLFGRSPLRRSSGQAWLRARD